MDDGNCPFIAYNLHNSVVRSKYIRNNFSSANWLFELSYHRFEGLIIITLYTHISGKEYITL